MSSSHQLLLPDCQGQDANTVSTSHNNSPNPTTTGSIFSNFHELTLFMPKIDKKNNNATDYEPLSLPISLQYS